jgi:type III restriction enzyme
MPRLRQSKILIENWHTLPWDSTEQIAKRKSVDKRGAKSNRAYCREVLGDMATAKNIIVLNDEAHHAWRVPAELS